MEENDVSSPNRGQNNDIKYYKLILEGGCYTKCDIYHLDSNTRTWKLDPRMTRRAQVFLVDSINTTDHYTNFDIKEKIRLFKLGLNKQLTIKDIWDEVYKNFQGGRELIWSW